MVDVRVLVLMQMLFICNLFGAVERPDIYLFVEGQTCMTAYVSSGKCMKKCLCDPAFIYSFSPEDHAFSCRQDPFVPTLCCLPFLDYCKDIKKKHIHNGKIAGKRMFPYIARLGNYDSDGLFAWRCSANIISSRFLLTAAHCRAAARIAGMGCTKRGFCEQNATVENFIPYAQYRTPSKYHDIALVELQENISFNKYVVPICPDFQTEDLPVTENLTVAGWGKTEDGVVSNHLMYAPVRTLPLEVCKAAYADPNLSMILQNKLSSGVIDKQYCAVGNFTENPFDNIDACQGDSGGPLQGLRNNTVFLIGVISAGIGCGSALPGLYARVGSYFEWIYTTITESESRQTCPPNRS